MRVIAFIEDARIAKRILDHLGVAARAPPRGRARGSEEEQQGLSDRVVEFDGEPLPSYE